MEDFTTYDEVDPNDDLAVTSTHIDVETMIRDVVAYLRKDYGVNHFGNFVDYVDVELGLAQTLAAFNVWGKSNLYCTRGQMERNVEGMYVRIGHNGAALKLEVGAEWDHRRADVDISVNTTYYLTIRRIATTLSLDVYLDAGRTQLHDSVAVECLPERYRYVLSGFSEDDTFYASNVASGWIENLVLVPLPPAQSTLTMCMCI